MNQPGGSHTAAKNYCFCEKQAVMEFAHLHCWRNLPKRNLEKEEWIHSFKSRSLFFFLAPRSKRERRRLVGLARKSHYSPNFRATTVLSVFNLFWGSAIIQSDTPMKIAEAEPRTLDFLIPTLKTDAKHHHCWQLQFTKGLACESNSLHTPQ